jgi:glycosyltransferase involved in cell wall biosynthesis
VGPIVAPRIATVVTLHDLIWLRQPELVGLDKGTRDRMQALVARSARRADRLIAGAQVAATDVQHTLGIPPSRIDVIPHGVRVADVAATGESELRARLGLGDRRMVLSVAQRRGYKQLDTLIRALAALGRDDVVLVLAGAPGPAEPELRALASELGVADRVVMPDWLSAEDLEGLYAIATCFVLPSLAEGFGMPILEAMARGVPVACSDISTLPEVAGDAALLFDPREQAAIDRALATLLGDEPGRHRLIAAGRARAAEFTWERTARQTRGTYEKALA